MQRSLTVLLTIFLFGCTDYSKARMYYITGDYISSSFKEEEINNGVLSKEGLLKLRTFVYTTCLSKNYTNYFLYEPTLVCSYREEDKRIRLNCKAMARCIE